MSSTAPKWLTRSRKLFTRCALGAAVLGVTDPTLAAEIADDTFKALPCRPTIACTPDIIVPGGLEFELGYRFRKLGDGAGQQSTPFLLKLSVARWLQLQLSGDGGVFTSPPAPAHYFDDVFFGLKFHMVDQEHMIPSIALSIAYGNPLLIHQLGFTPTKDLSAIAYATKDIDWLHADFNVGVTVWRLEQAPVSQGFVALALSRDLPAKFGVMLEGYFYSSAGTLVPRDGGILGAVTYSPSPWLTFDAGGIVGFFASTSPFSVFVGMTILPVQLWETGEDHAARQRQAAMQILANP